LTEYDRSSILRSPTSKSAVPPREIYSDQVLKQKTGDMAVGQVSFHSDKKVKRGASNVLAEAPDASAGADNVGYLAHVTTRDNSIVNRLNKTKLEKEVDHEAERQERLREEGRRKTAEAADRVSSGNP